jgi:GNAT superfamily N-acetyltransferase
MTASKQKRETPALSASSIEILPLTADRWMDFQSLFGHNGAYGGCWCMWWRLKRSEFDHQKGEGNRLAMQAIVESGEVPGLLAYADGKPIGWCSIAPRASFPALDRSRVLARVDDEPVWSIVCFFVARGYRRQGVTIRLIQAAIEYAISHGAKIVEGYPKSPTQVNQPDIFVFTGLLSAFQKTGFKEVLRRSETRPIMRYTIE